MDALIGNRERRETVKQLGPLVRCHDGGSVYVVEVATRGRTRVAKGVMPDRFDKNTLVMGPDPIQIGRRRR
jgi:hypothetical protein